MSALEGLLMYGSYRENNRDPEICPLYRGVRYRGVSVKRGFTVFLTPYNVGRSLSASYSAGSPLTPHQAGYAHFGYLLTKLAML